jgi:hypothetical protein
MKIIEIIAQFNNAMIDWARLGWPTVDREEHDRRMKVCKSCEHICDMRIRCKICYCLIMLKTKLKNQTCPDGRW